MKFLISKLDYYWQKGKYFCVHSILHADDPPHTLAMGIAAGMFVALLPLIGIQMVLGAAAAWLVRGNKAVAVAMVWISNPVTMVPIYYPGYWLGCKILRIPAQSGWIEILQSNARWVDKIWALADRLAEEAVPLFLGTFILAIPAAVFSYYGSLYVIKSYRMKRFGQLMPPKLTPPVDESGEAEGTDQPSDGS